MRGQKLFIRAIESPDHDAVRTFLRIEAGGMPVPACGLLGKLVGDIVGILAMQITPDAIQIDHIVVARNVRRKRIGRFLVDEAGHLAAKIDRQRLIAEASGAGDEFFRRIGFQREGSRWFRSV